MWGEFCEEYAPDNTKSNKFKSYNWTASNGYGYIADGNVLAKDYNEALNKVRKEYDDENIKIEIEDTYGTEEHKEITGLYIRWEK